MTKPVGAAAFAAGSAFLLLVAASSSAADQTSPSPATKPAENVESIARLISMMGETVNKIVPLTDAQKLKLDDISAAMREKYGKEMNEGKADAFLTDYINRVKKILTPEQRAVFEPRMEMARRAANETRNRVRCATHLKQIGAAMLLYSNEHRGKFPPDLGSLITSKQDIEPETFLCPDTHTKLPLTFRLWARDKQAEWINANSDYVYRGGKLTNSESPEKVIVYEKPDNHVGAVSTKDEGGGGILFGDGHVEFLKSADFTRVVKQGMATTLPTVP